MLRIELDSVRRDGGGGTYRMINRASAAGLENVGDGSNLHLLCKKLIEAGHDPDEPCEVWRGSMPVFSQARLRFWADRPDPWAKRRES